MSPKRPSSHGSHVITSSRRQLRSVRAWTGCRLCLQWANGVNRQSNCLRYGLRGCDTAKCLSCVCVPKGNTVYIFTYTPTLVTGIYVKDELVLKGGGGSKSTPLQAWIGPEGSRSLRLDNRHMEVVSLSALRTGHLYPPRKHSWYSFLLEAESSPEP